MLSSLYASVFGASGASAGEQVGADVWVQKLRDETNAVANCDVDSAEYAKHRQAVAHCVSAIKAILFSGEATPPGDANSAVESVGKGPSGSTGVSGSTSAGDISQLREQARELARLACCDDLLLLLASNLRYMGFETRKNAVQVFNNLLRQPAPRESLSSTPLSSDASSFVTTAAAQPFGDDSAVGNENANVPVLERIVEAAGSDLVCTLVRGYDHHELALNSGAMLRECLRSEALCRILLHDPVFWRMFEWVEQSNFDVASHAQNTFKELLTRHPTIAAEFIETEFARFFEHFNRLLRSQNYVARRVSLKLLGEMLLERSNFNIMTEYIASSDNLKLIMNLLLDNRKNIQYEAFHVFKIFVANPNKAPAVASILKKNQAKMVSYLEDFLTDREDEQFHEDREMIIEEIRDL